MTKPLGVGIITTAAKGGVADPAHLRRWRKIEAAKRQLKDYAHRLHGDVKTVVGDGLAAYGREPWLDNGVLAWRDVPATSGDTSVLRPVNEPFSADGGLRLGAVETRPEFTAEAASPR